MQKHKMSRKTNDLFCLTKGILFFLPITFWDLRKACCHVGEKSGEMCHWEMRRCRGSHCVHVLSLFILLR